MSETRSYPPTLVFTASQNPYIRLGEYDLDEFICSFFAKHDLCTQLHDDEDLLQFDEDAMDVIDIRWQVAYDISMDKESRANGRNVKRGLWLIEDSNSNYLVATSQSIDPALWTRWTLMILLVQHSSMHATVYSCFDGYKLRGGQVDKDQFGKTSKDVNLVFFLKILRAIQKKIQGLCLSLTVDDLDGKGTLDIMLRLLRMLELLVSMMSTAWTLKNYYSLWWNTLFWLQRATLDTEASYGTVCTGCAKFQVLQRLSHLHTVKKDLYVPQTQPNLVFMVSGRDYPFHLVDYLVDCFPSKSIWMLTSGDIGLRGTSPHSRACNSARDAQGTPLKSVLLSRLLQYKVMLPSMVHATSKGDCLNYRRHADFQGRCAVIRFGIEKVMRLKKSILTEKCRFNVRSGDTEEVDWRQLKVYAAQKQEVLCFMVPFKINQQPTQEPWKLPNVRCEVDRNIQAVWDAEDRKERVDDDFWKDQEEWEIISWRLPLHEISGGTIEDRRWHLISYAG
ncbi:hypothetical protein Tco_0116508 [Tanacetum coccineum]